MDDNVYYEDFDERTQHAIDLIVLDNNKFMERTIRQYLWEQGFRFDNKSLIEIKKILEDKGYELEILLTNLDITEEIIGCVVAQQGIRLKLKRKLVA